jgi:hypothetical protein
MNFKSHPEGYTEFLSCCQAEEDDLEGFGLVPRKGVDLVKEGLVVHV